MAHIFSITLLWDATGDEHCGQLPSTTLVLRPFIHFEEENHLKGHMQNTTKLRYDMLPLDVHEANHAIVARAPLSFMDKVMRTTLQY